MRSIATLRSLAARIPLDRMRRAAVHYSTAARTAIARLPWASARRMFERLPWASARRLFERLRLRGARKRLADLPLVGGAFAVRFRLRWKILIAVVLAPVALAAGTLWIVNHRVSENAISEIHDDLERAALIFENTLAARTQALSTAAQIIVRDPRFFSALALPGSAGNRHYRDTVRGVARDFRNVTEADLFEVLDRSGDLIASVGHESSSAEGRKRLLDGNETGSHRANLLIEDGSQFQVTTTPVEVDGRVVGTLVLGSEIGGALARQLQMLTRSDVTFVSEGAITGTTFESADDASALLGAIAAPRVKPEPHSPDMERIESEHQTYLTLARSIPGSRNGLAQFYVMQRSLDAETGYLRRIQGQLLQLGFMTLVVALLIGQFVSRRITRPILEVVRGAEEMERGNYDHPITVGEADEIGYLANRFQEMRRNEQVYVNSLQEVARLKSEFISVASHELRTPVSIIQGFSEMLATGTLGRLTAKQREAAKAINESVETLARLAEDATRMAQIEGERMTLYKEDHDVVALIEEAASAALANAKGRSVEVTLEAAPDIGVACIDGPRLLQAVLQLVRNGIRFTPDGGSVEIVARRAGERLEIEVSDTGVGIAEDKLPRLFDRAFSVRDSANHHSSSTLEFNSAGLGLGLAIAHGIAEAHGGSINVESRVGEGSRFTLRIPIVAAHDVAA